MKSFFIGNIEIKTPVIQGGMGVGISLSGLASAVANEGGVGVISCAGLGLLYPKGKGTYPEKCINGLKEEIRKARAKTKGIIGVNVMVALSNYADMVRTAIEEKIDVVFLIPEVVMIASSYKEQKQIPVIAAGGISTGEDIAHFMGLGAAGVQMGSIFVTTQECDASETFKEVYIHSKSEDVLIIESPVGMPGRAIDGEFIHNVNSGLERPKSCSFHCIKTCDYTKSPYCIIKALYNAAKGNMKKGYAFAGSNAFLAEKISSVKEVMSTLEREFFLATHKLA